MWAAMSREANDAWIARHGRGIIKPRGSVSLKEFLDKQQHARSNAGLKQQRRAAPSSPDKDPRRRTGTSDEDSEEEMENELFGEDQDELQKDTGEEDEEVPITTAQKQFIEMKLEQIRVTKKAPLRSEPPNPLQDQVRREVTPDDFCTTTLHLWDPERAFDLGKACCPHCGKNDTKRVGYSAPRGFIALDRTEWFAGVIYRCKECRRKFRNYIPEVLSQLPFFAQRAFPAVFSHKGGISIEVMTLLKLSIAHRMSVRGFAELLMETHRRRHLICSGAYYSLMKSRQGKQRITRDKWGKVHLTTGGPPTQFPDFHTGGGKRFSPGYFGTHLVQDFLRRKRLLTQRIMMVKGEVLSGDMSFKVVKHLNVAGVTYAACWSVMNEYGQVLGVYFCRTKSLAEVVDAHHKIQARYKRAKLDGPKLFYSDQAGLDEPTLIKCHPTLKPRVTTFMADPPDDPSHLRLPQPPIYVHDDASCAYACDILRRCKVLGFDCEWNMKASVSRPRPTDPATGTQKLDGMVATVQLSSQLTAAVFHLAAFGDNTMPAALRKLLEDSSIAKVGVASRGDATRLRWDYNVEVANVRSTDELAKNVLSLQKSGWKLKRLCDLLLGKELPKEKVVSHNMWETVPLPEDELNYAALDAFASVLVHMELENMAMKSTHSASGYQNAEAVGAEDGSSSSTIRGYLPDGIRDAACRVLGAVPSMRRRLVASRAARPRRALRLSAAC